MSKYLHLNQTREKYWGKLRSTDRNYTDVLVALECASQLSIKDCVTIPDFNEHWGSQLAEAKDLLRELHKSVMGFEPHGMLEMVRRIQEMRCHDTRTLRTGFGNRVLGNIIRKNVEGLNEDLHVHAAAATEHAQNTVFQLMPSFKLFVADPGSEEASIIRAKGENISSSLFQGRINELTRQDIKVRSKVTEQTVRDLVLFSGIVNTLNFKTYERSITAMVAEELREKLVVPVEFKESFHEAITDLVEV